MTCPYLSFIMSLLVHVFIDCTKLHVDVIKGGRDVLPYGKREFQFLTTPDVVLGVDHSATYACEFLRGLQGHAAMFDHPNCRRDMPREFLGQTH